jgi:ribosomal protein S18 acetylase RimI-like enzyme
MRPAAVEDAAVIAEVHLRSREFAYRGLMPGEYLNGMVAAHEDRMVRWRSNLATAGPDVRCWLAEDDGTVVGFASTGPSGDADAAPKTGEVLAIYLAPEAIGCGIGRTLFQHAVDDLMRRDFAPLTLWVLDQNQRARHFYEAAG